jgi:hypothetical protein
VLVKRAADDAAGSRPRFVRALLAQVPEAERAALQQALDALPP